MPALLLSLQKSVQEIFMVTHFVYDKNDNKPFIRGNPAPLKLYRIAL
jgi:hypothetical protein